MTFSRNATTGPAIDTTRVEPSILTSQMPGLIVSYGDPHPKQIRLDVLGALHDPWKVSRKTGARQTGSDLIDNPAWLW